MLESTTGVETIGDRLHRLRVGQGLSQRALAGPGVTGAYISQIERGTKRPSVKVLRVLAGRLGVTAAYLETGSELGHAYLRELRLAEAELRLRLEGQAPTEELRVILGEAIASADDASVVRARVALGLEAAGRGDHAEAIAQLGPAIASERVTPALRPDVYAALGESYALAGEPGRAVSLFEGGLVDLERLAPNDFPTRVRFSTYLSYALTDLGQLERASEVVEDALAFADRASDPYLRVRLYWALGRISHEQSKPLLALEYFRRAVALLESTEDTFHLARAYLSCASAILASGQNTAEARRQVEKAEQLLGPKPEPRDLAVVHRLKAMHAIEISEYATAERHARAAQALTEQQPNQYGLATWVLADALAGQGDTRAGETYAEATRLLRGHGTPREQLELSLAHARYVRTRGREDEATADRVSAGAPAGTRVAPRQEGLLSPRDEAGRERDSASVRRARATARRHSTAAKGDEVAGLRDLAASARDRSAERRDTAVGAAAGRQAADREQGAADLGYAGLDELNGIFRRGTGELMLTHEIDRSRRSDQSLVMAMIEIDKLKAVNDSHLHPAGDALIRGVAKAITSTLRSYDVTVHWGGDEFVCSLSGVTPEVGSDRVAEIKRALETYQPGASISAGLAQLGDDDTFESLLARADTALTRAKAGRGL